MLKNYLRIALRTLGRSRLSAVVNIGGLAIGMTVAMLIGLWIVNEVSFDRNFDHYRRIGKIWQFVTFVKGVKVPYDVIPEPMGPELRSSFPDFDKVSMASIPETQVVQYADKKLPVHGLYAEPDFADIFSVSIESGRRQRDMHDILVDAPTAQAIFGDKNPIGQVLKISDTIVVRVSGIFKAFPANSSLDGVHFVAPWSLYQATNNNARGAKTDWGNNSFNVYVQLKANADVKNVSNKIRDILLKTDNPPVYRPEFFVFPMDRWHLYRDFHNGVNVGGFIEIVRLFGIIGIFVLLLACINFMNLSTARSERRAREVGIRKTIGSVRSQLIVQFFVESAVIALIAFGLSAILTWLTLPLFAAIAGKTIPFPWTDPVFWMAGALFSVLTGFIAGSYPALYLSSFKPIKVLKRTSRLAALPRRALVVLQFSISVALIIGTAVVYRQIGYARDRPTGYDRSGMIEVNINTPALNQHFDVLRTQLLATGAVTDVTECSSSMTDQNNGTTDIDWKGKEPGTHPLVMSSNVTPEYGRTIGWRITRGRDFSRDYATDSTAMVLSESAVALMRFKQPLGELVQHNGHTYHVIGVVDNILKESPFEPIKPAFFTQDGWFSVIDIKLTPVSGAIPKVESVFRQFNPGAPFAFHWVNQDYARKFDSEVRVGELATVFAALAILISCLGLFGLATFVAEQRTKEVGIRKVLGASVFTLWRLLSREFVLLVLLSLLIAIPVARYYMGHWLEHYDYHTGLAWWIFAGAGLGAIVVTLATVSFQAIRAALANPVHSLRSE
ncbi:MAG TPA: ABC transporter permease [Dinghuibacter sp.]|uniref:ABC transporter permease n=1 Tax=Dinghuibacter sp. TaxID=2024697 RepID=UPI002C2643F2|nr:ABC transporter permease [Dinghuibacter sp.]HTJ11032.1 ABC transporter permease [Dinghuibacter sp.]